MMPRKQIFFLVLLFFSRKVFSETDEFIFNGFKHATDNISLNGIAEIEQNGMLKLTDNTVRIFGHAFYSNPFKFKDSINGKAFSFSTAFAFAIKPEYEGLGGHGMAFAISPTKGIQGALPNQYLGLLNATVVGNFSNHFFAVEFDNVEDVGFNDTSDRHVGINFNSLVSNASVNVSYYLDENGEKKALNMQSGKTIQAWIDYDSTRHELNVSLSISSKKPKLSILSFPVDLSAVLDEYAYVGFSASTGQKLASSHYVLGWSFKKNGEAQSLDLSSLPSFPGPKKSRLALTLGVSLSVVMFVVIALVLGMYIFMRIKNMDVIEPWEFEVGPHRYSYEELKKATRGFRDKELLGFGGFGKVYKGTLPKTKTCVAVKRINNESRQGLHEFVSEIATIGHLRHRNLVQLLGWCRRRVDLLLVYEFMPNGSLDKYLFDEPKVMLTWQQRFKIIKGVASGLLYLHEEWDQAVIHRDIKAGNVLLDSEMNGKLGDFGLAKLYEHGANPSTTRVVGTLGYLAPELTKTGMPSTSSDVFAFGALLLEVVCGRRPVELKALPEELILVDWVTDKLNTGDILEVVDKKLRCDFDELEVIMVLKLGLMCSNDEPAKRPKIKEVVRYLDGEAELPAVEATPVGFSVKKGEKESASMSKLKDFVVSYPSFSYFEKVSDWSSAGRGDRDVHLEAGSMSLLSTYGREEFSRKPFKTRRGNLVHVASFKY